MKYLYFKAIFLLSVSQFIYAADPQLNSSFKVQAKIENGSSTNYLSYKLYNSSSLSNEYIVGNKYLLPATTPTNRLANFEIYGVVDLENNNEPHAAGIYKDTVSIMITW